MPDTKENDVTPEESYYNSLGESDVNQGIQDAEDYANQDDGLGKQAAKKGADKGVEKLAAKSGAASTAMKATPWGRVLSALSFIKRNKKAAVSGGGIIAFIISVAIFITTVLTPSSQIIWMSSILGDFNFGPNNRNAGSRVANIINRTSELRNNDTRMGRQANAISSDQTRMNRVNNTENRMFIRGNQRFNFRETINRRINTVRGRIGLSPRSWSIFEGNPRTAEGYRNPGNRIRGTDSARASTRTVPGPFQDAVETARTSDNPRSTRAQSIRSITKANASTALIAAGCATAIISDVIPDEEERYEILMSRGADIYTAGSQASAGENVHGDEAADFMDEFYETRTVVQADSDIADNLSEDDLNIREDEDEKDIEIEGTAQELGLDGESDVEERDYSFSNTAAWKRNTRQEPDGNEIDVNMSFAPENTLWANTILRTGDLINTLTFGRTGSVCAVLASGVVSYSLAAVEWTITIFTGGLAGIGRLGVGEFAAFIIGTAILNAAYDGLVPETPEELFAQTDMGSNVANSENSRNQGAPPSDEMNEERLDNFREYAQEDRERGFVWRYMSPQNHRSALSQVAMSNGPLRGSDLIRPFLNFSSTIANTFSRISMPVSADNHLDEFDNYGIEQFHYESRAIDEIDPVENDEFIAYVDGEEFDLEGRGYYCTFDEMEGFKWDELPDEEREGLEQLGNGEQIRADLMVYYNFEGPPDPDDPDGELTECETDRWRDAVLMYELINKCMEPPYYEMEEWTSYRYNELATDALGNPEVRTTIVPGDEDIPSGNPPWVKQFGWGTPFNQQLGGISFDCRSPESLSYTDSRGRGDTVRQFWERVGLRRLDQDLMNVIDCLSHEDRCDLEGHSGSDRDYSSNQGLMTPDNLTQEGCPDPYYKMPESEDGIYTMRSTEARRCGHLELIEVLYTVANNYYDQYGPESRLDIGDLNAGAPHVSHRWGIAADLNAKGNPEAARTSSANYSTEATIDLGKMFVDTGLIGNIWYCDGGDGSVNAISDYADEQGNPVEIRCIEGHANHFHIDLDEEKVPRGPEHAP